MKVDNQTTSPDNVSDTKTKWSALAHHLKNHIGDQAFDTWFGQTQLLTWSDDRVIVEVPSRFVRDWILDHYNDVVQSSLQAVTANPPPLHFVVGSERPQPAVPVEPQPVGRQPEGLRLNPRYTFDRFIIGASNRFAHAAAMAVAESPAKAYNPLFIYGGVGLGKTHLLQAVGHALLSRHHNVRVLYISSEQFTNQLISAIQHRSTIRFREQYRTVDALLIDDIHFIAGKESTQEEFFHTFNTLYDAHKQIIVSSDRQPKDIPGLEERLVSRFEWGLVTDIQPPDLETRVAILNKKAEESQVLIPSDVVFFIAEKIRSNIRELEGAMIRVAAYATLFGKPVDIELTKEVLKDLLAESEHHITVDLIQRRVAEFFDIRLSDMKARRRTRSVAYPRQIAMYLTRELVGLPLLEIGEQFGGRDHTTVLHACEKIHQQLTEDRELRAVVDRLAENLKTGGRI